MTKPEIIARLLEPGIVAVLRVDAAAALLPICEALLAGGVTALEVTLTSPDALTAIAEARRRFAGRGALVGAGTVLDPETGRAAILAGAEFVVTPVCRPAIVATRIASRTRAPRSGLPTAWIKVTSWPSRTAAVRIPDL